MIKLKLIRGQKVFSVNLGECTVVAVHNDNNYPILVRDCSGVYSDQYDLTGRLTRCDAHPSLFESIETCKDYFNSLSDITDIVDNKEAVNG